MEKPPENPVKSVHEVVDNEEFTIPKDLLKEAGAQNSRIIRFIDFLHRLSEGRIDVVATLPVQREKETESPSDKH